MGGKTDFIAVFLRDLDRPCTKPAARPDDRPWCFVKMLLDPLHTAFQLTDQELIAGVVAHVDVVHNTVSLMVN